MGSLACVTLTRGKVHPAAASGTNLHTKKLKILSETGIKAGWEGNIEPQFSFS
jgi:hypothetical protein